MLVQREAIFKCNRCVGTATGMTHTAALARLMRLFGSATLVGVRGLNYALRVLGQAPASLRRIARRVWTRERTTISPRPRFGVTKPVCS